MLASEDASKGRYANAVNTKCVQKTFVPCHGRSPSIFRPESQSRPPSLQPTSTLENYGSSAKDLVIEILIAMLNAPKEKTESKGRNVFHAAK